LLIHTNVILLIHTNVVLLIFALVLVANANRSAASYSAEIRNLLIVAN
jgi:hypothetical protein